VQTPEGVRVPEVLQPYMGGMTFMPFVRPKPVTGGGAAGKSGAAAGGGGGGGAKAAGGAGKAPAPALVPAPAAATTAAAGAGAGAAAAAAGAAAPAPTAAPAAAVGPATQTLSAAMLGFPTKVGVATPGALAALNTALAARSYVAGHTTTAEDEAVFGGLAAAGITADSERVKALPNLNRWLRHVKSYTPAERALWPLTFAQLTSGALHARQSTLFL